MTKEKIISRLIKLREELGYSQKVFSDKIGITPGFYNDIEKGRSNVSVNFLSKISLAFNVSIDWLLTGKGNMFLPSVMSPADNKKKDNGNTYDVIDGNAETFPQVDRVEKISRTSWFENLSSDKKTLVAAIDEISDESYLKKIKDHMLLEVEMERAAKKKADEEKDSSLKQKGEAG